jgi:AcrR family transcriptional regulator
MRNPIRRNPPVETVPGSQSATAPDRLLPRGRHDLPREFIARTQRDRLLDAMAKTVETKGFAVTVTELCKAAKVSTKNFYDHFADKEACFFATFDRGVMLLLRSVSAAYAQPERWPFRIRRGIEVLLHLLAAEPAFANLAVVEMVAAGPRGRERSRRLRQAYLQFFDDAPVRADQPPVPRVVVEAVAAGVFGLLFDYVSIKRTAELPDLLPEITYFVLVPFIGPREAAKVAKLSPSESETSAKATGTDRQ